MSHSKMVSPSGPGNSRDVFTVGAFDPSLNSVIFKLSKYDGFTRSRTSVRMFVSSRFSHISSQPSQKDCRTQLHQSALSLPSGYTFTLPRFP